WTVLAVELAWRKGGRRIALAAVVAAIQVLSGTPEIVIFTWVALGAFWLLEFISGDISRARILGRFLLVVLLVTALSTVQALPFLDLLAHSTRDTNSGASAWPMPVSGWVNFLVPLFH